MTRSQCNVRARGCAIFSIVKCEINKALNKIIFQIFHQVLQVRKFRGKSGAFAMQTFMIHVKLPPNILNNTI